MRPRKLRKPSRSQQRQPVEDRNPDGPFADAPSVPAEPSAGAEASPDPSTQMPPRFDNRDDQAVPRSRMRFLRRTTVERNARPEQHCRPEATHEPAATPPQIPKGHTMSPARQACTTLVIATAVALFATTATGLVTPSAASTLTAGPSAKAWCMLAIKINTQYGTMKNKHYLPGNKVPLKSQEALISAAIAQRTQILAVTPTVIKKAMTDELTYYAHLKARGYTNPGLLTPFTIAEAGQLLTYQHKYCGIT